jgi:hypothetical protein
MNRHFDIDAIVHPFTLLPPEIDFLGTNKPHNHLGKALLLKFFQAEGRFPKGEDDFPLGIIEYVARQLNLLPKPSRNMPGMDGPSRIIGAKSGSCWAIIVRLWLTKMPCSDG